MELQLVAGKSYHINIPNGHKPTYKVHVDYILDDIGYPEEDDKLIVYRIWIAHKQYWKNYIEPYSTLAIYNDWKYKK